MGKIRHFALYFNFDINFIAFKQCLTKKRASKIVHHYQMFVVLSTNHIAEQLNHNPLHRNATPI